jgi:glycosyltransferase involved in cell wall biosynthesis
MLEINTTSIPEYSTSSLDQPTEVEANPNPVVSSNFVAFSTPLVVVVIPAFNEERFIGSVVITAKRYADAVVVVDDGSKDHTSEIARLAGAVVVKHEVNKGKGIALNTGFAKAKELFLPEVIVTMDGDWQHDPEELPKLIEPILKSEADIVIGSRYLENRSDVPRQRVLGHRGFNVVLNHLSGTLTTDSQSGFRAFSLEAAKALHFDSVGFSVESEMQFLATRHRLRVKEVPITIRYLDKPKRALWKHGLKVLNGILELIGQHRPLLFFGVPGMIMVLMGVVIGVLVLETYNMVGAVPLWEAALLAFLWITGTVMLFTGLILHSLRGLILEFTRPSSKSI